MNEDEIDLIAERWRDGDLSHVEAQNIADYLAGNDDERIAFLERLRLAQTLHCLMQPQSPDLIHRVISVARARQQGFDKPLVRRTMARARRGQKQEQPAQMHRIHWSLWASAATLLTTIGLLLFYSNYPNNTASKSLIDQSAGHWLSFTTPGSLNTPDGSHIEYLAGTRLRILTSSAGIELDTGTIRCSVVLQPKGSAWHVDSALADVSVLGTRFTLKAEAGGLAVAVDHGRVAVDPKNGISETTQLDAGQALWINSQGLTIPADNGEIWVPVWTPKSDELLAGSRQDDGWSTAPTTKIQRNEFFQPDSYVQWYSKPITVGAQNSHLFNFDESMRIHATLLAPQPGTLMSTWQNVDNTNSRNSGVHNIPIIAGQNDIRIPIVLSDGQYFPVTWFALWGEGLGEWRLHTIEIERKIDLSFSGFPDP